MKGLYLILVSSIVILLLCSCSVTKINNSSTVKADLGYIHITGNVEGISVYINNVEQVLVYKHNSALIQVPAGNYELKITRANSTLVDQKIIVSISNTTEVIVP